MKKILIFRALKVIMVFIVCFILLQNNKMYSQDLSEHRWENRIIIIKADETSALLSNQIKEFKQDTKGLAERKIIIYQIKDDKFSVGLDGKNAWQKIENKRLLKISKPENTDFQVILIGLDGGIKHTKDSLMTLEELFSKIDVMPMRMQELEKDK